MFLIYRALNDLDIACNPLFNGLVSKKLIYDLTSSYLQNNYGNFFNSLSNEEKDIYIKENMVSYLKDHQHKLKKIFEKKGSLISNNLSRIEYGDEQDWGYLLSYLSTLNTHLTHGSKVYTDWISASKDFTSIFKYYQNQSTHKIAVMRSNSNGMLDDNTIVLDLSSKNVIRDISALLPKKLTNSEIEEILRRIKTGDITDFLHSDIIVPTKENYRGFNYAVADKEICIYRYYPSEKIISVLEPIQIDLIILKLFNFDYIQLDKLEQVKQLRILKDKIRKRILDSKDYYMLHIFEEIYEQNRNIEEVRENIFDDKRINNTRAQILRLAKSVQNVQIKR